MPAIQLGRSIPGDYTLRVVWSGKDELRLEDKNLYGRTTMDDRREIENRLIVARRDTTDKGVAAIQEAKTEARVAHAYVWGILDTCKDLLSTGQFEAFLNGMWSFSTEVEYAAYMFHSDQSTGKQGYALAWATFLRYNPQVDAILHRVIVAARPL